MKRKRTGFGVLAIATLLVGCLSVAAQNAGSHGPATPAAASTSVNFDAVVLSAEQQVQLTQQAIIIEFDAPRAGRRFGEGTFPQDNNPEGAITGYYVDGNVVYHGFLRATDGTITSFDAPGSGRLKDSAQGTVPLGINPQGEIAGQYQDENYLYHGFLRATDGTFAIINAPGAGAEASQGTIVASITPEGLMSGSYIDANNVYHGFERFPDGAITTFDDPNAGCGSGQGTIVYFMNPKGAITGFYLDNNNVQHGFLRSVDGTFTTIDGPSAASSIAVWITPNGTITGYFNADADNVYHSFLRAPDGTMTFFDDPNAGTGPNQGTTAFALNPADTIAGLYIDASNVQHGFQRTSSGVFTTIDAPGASGTSPASINPAGAITGRYFDKNNVNHGFLWTPQTAH
jgi:hypothetical protein